MQDLEVEIVSVLPWEASAGVADRFRAGRVFFAGDAAHVMPPAGSLGLNTGVQDAHNLAWKLAAVEKGVADRSLLETYDAERRQAALLAVAYATGELEAASPDAPTDPLGAVLCYRYRSAAVLPDGSPEARSASTLDGRPGTRAPHLWLERGGRRISTLDLYDGRFVLVAGPAGEGWVRAARDVGGEVNAVLEVHKIGPGGDLIDRAGAWCEAHSAGPAGAVLVRPDGFVGWRTRGDRASDLDAALRRLLGRPARGFQGASF